MPGGKDLWRYTNGEWLTAVESNPGTGSPMIFTSSWDKTIKVWKFDCETTPEVSIVDLHKDKINAFVMWRNVMITGSEDGHVKVLKMSNSGPKDGKMSVELGNVDLLADIDIGCRVLSIAFPPMAEEKCRRQRRSASRRRRASFASAG